MRFYKSYQWLLPSLLFTLALVALRMIVMQKVSFLFMVWNLFLATLPLYFSHKAKYSGKKSFAFVWAALWLLFFPNSMYIVTDIFHLEACPPVPRWFDLVLLTSGAINGLIFGFLSLNNIEQQVKAMINARYINLFLLAIFLLCGYGIYLGRYLRWNSWDVVAEPFSLARDISYHVLHPARNIHIWELSLVFGCWLFITYGFLKRLKRKAADF